MLRGKDFKLLKLFINPRFASWVNINKIKLITVLITPLFISFCFTKSTNDMSFKLQNEYLSLDIQKPGELYKKARFDWTGEIIQVTFLNKHTFCTTEKTDDKLVNDFGRALYNEFGIDKPVGYDDCKVGEKFPKIGVGLLTKKSTKPYNFFEDYEVTPYSFTFSANDTEAVFVCKSSEDQEYSFVLEKRITLDKNTFTIHYSLTNNGKKEIRTNEYVHNFLSINGNPIDEDYKLSLPFQINPEKFRGTVNPGNVVQFDSNTVSLKSMPEGEFYFGNMNTDYKRKGEWTLINSKDKIGIQETTDFNIQRINLWGAWHVISPEIFFDVIVAPGKNLRWTRTYKVFTLG